MANRLSEESSPYLLQHQDNPVDWYPWGREAFDAARAQGKPVFVSIGYAACHWCHVMAHESFEDDHIAELMNELFINVKVDREERPDVDAVYMNAIHVMGESGGWPLSAFCDSDGKPYYLGTYFPPVDRYGRPGFPTVLKTMARVFREQPDKVAENTEAVLDGLRRMDEHFRRTARTAARDVDSGMVVSAARTLVQASDPEYGGFGRKPKFPSSSAHELLARASRLPFGGPARAAFLLQCEKMAAGGIYDHLGGGFARYSVDERWLVPHFEKMLYDNAQLLGIYADAYAMTGEERYAEVIAETAGYLERDLSDPAGGFYASQDADSEGEEGKYYVWTPAQIERVLGPADAIQFTRAYGVRDGGNFEHGTTVLERVTPRGDTYQERALADMRARLLAARSQRVPPATDTKVLASWNGLAIEGLVRAWAVTREPPLLTLAERAAGFVRDVMLSEESGQVRLARVFKDGTARLEGTLDDYTFVARAYQLLAEATSDRQWWDLATRLLEVVLARFYEEQDGVGIFYMSPADAGDGLVHRPESYQDGALPSGASVAVQALIRAGRVGGDSHALAVAEAYLRGRTPSSAEQPYSSSRLLAALDDLTSGIEVVVSDGSGRAELLAALRRTHAPTAMLAGEWAAAELTRGKKPDDQGRALAYVCRGQTCSAPVHDPDELRAILEPVVAGT